MSEPGGPGFDLNVFAQIAASLGTVAAAMAREEARNQQLAHDCWYVHTPDIGFTALPYAAPDWGPNVGFAWAIQAVRVQGFGASTDKINLFRGNSTANVNGPDGLFTFTVPATGEIASWAPGRTGCVLMGGEGLAFGGTFTGTLAMVSIDVIQVTYAALPYFLM